MAKNGNEEKHTLQKPRSTMLTAIAFLALAWPTTWPTALPAQQALQERLVEQSTGIPAAQVATGRHGMVASQDSQATRIGLDVLERGGNAVDAAVAIGFALAVTVPKAGNIGGGGFMLMHIADSNENAAIDYRETAPAATSADVFLGPDGEADPAKSRDTGLGVGVPGTVAGLSLALGRFRKIYLGGIGGAGGTLGPGGRRDQRRPLRFAAARTATPGAVADRGADFSETRRRRARLGRQARSARTRRSAGSDRT
jgi:Gamma-glutamyltranspeptidase